MFNVCIERIENGETRELFVDSTSYTNARDMALKKIMEEDPDFFISDQLEMTIVDLNDVVFH